MRSGEQDYHGQHTQSKKKSQGSKVCVAWGKYTLKYLGEEEENIRISIPETQRRAKKMLDLRTGIFFMVQWLRLCASSSGSRGLIPGWGIKILHAGASLLVQWLSICLAMQGTRV